MPLGKISKKQEEILEYIKSELLSKGYPPAVRRAWLPHARPLRPDVRAGAGALLLCPLLGGSGVSGQSHPGENRNRRLQRCKAGGELPVGHCCGAGGFCVLCDPASGQLWKRWAGRGVNLSLF